MWTTRSMDFIDSVVEATKRPVLFPPGLLIQVSPSQRSSSSHGLWRGVKQRTPFECQVVHCT